MKVFHRCNQMADFPGWDWPNRVSSSKECPAVRDGSQKWHFPLTLKKQSATCGEGYMAGNDRWLLGPDGLSPLAARN